jgi:hypothetical protein
MLAEDVKAGDKRVMAMVEERRRHRSGFLRQHVLAARTRHRSSSLDSELRDHLVATVAQRPRERRQRRTSGASAGGGDPPEPPLERPLSQAERLSLKTEVDRCRRLQLVAERDHLRAVPAGGWAA